MYDQPPPMKIRRPPMQPPPPGGGPTPPSGGGAGLVIPPPIRQPPQIPGGSPGPTQSGGYPANDLPPRVMGGQAHLNPMPPRTGGFGGPRFGGGPVREEPSPRFTRPRIPGGGPGPTQMGGPGIPGLAPGPTPDGLGGPDPATRRRLQLSALAGNTGPMAPRELS